MSHETYSRELQSTHDFLNSTLQLEPAQADRREHRQLLATLYLRYILIANRLGECVDQIIQPQKRLLARRLLEATLGRILELKSDLVEADLCEWTHCGDVIEDLGITPLQAELQVPRCFLDERREEMEHRKNVVDNVLRQLGFLDKPEEKAKMTEQQAILIIQIHERARQGRLRAQFMREIRTVKDRGKTQATEEDEAKSGVLSLQAAMRIQKVWKGYQARRATRRRKFQEMLLIGMIPPPKTQSEEIAKALEVKEMRRRLQQQRQKEYEAQVKACRERLQKQEREAVLEQLTDQVRGWLMEYKSQTGKIPEYSGSERVSSRLMLSRQGTDSDGSKSTQQEPKAKKSSSKSAKSKDSRSTEEEEDEQLSRAMVSTFVPELTVRKEEFDEVWKNKDETANPQQRPYSDMIEQEQMAEMENELRKIVDEMMGAELQLLQDAFDRDRGHKGKKPKKASKVRGKKSKKKKEKDLTPDRTIESLFEELVANGIIRRHPEVHLSDFTAERSYYPPVPHNKGKEQPNMLGDVKQLLTEYCIIPLLTPKLHESTPHVKSLLLAGGKGSGKDMLVQAVCTEAGALLFDLTPSNIVGKYPGKSGLTMLIHLVTKVARLLQPAVIYMDCAERPFVKKIPKTDRSDPKRLKKDLPKIVKNFSPEDRVILIGVSSCPWDSDQKLLQQVYQKYIIVPRLDYSSRYSIWTHFLGQYSAISWQFDTSVMTRVSDGYTVGSIIETIKEVMTVKRTLQLRVHPLNPMELVNALCRRTPVYREEEEAMDNWWTKTPLVKRRLRAIEELIEEEAEQQAKQANAKTKKQISS